MSARENGGAAVVNSPSLPATPIVLGTLLAAATVVTSGADEMRSSDLQSFSAYEIERRGSMPLTTGEDVLDRNNFDKLLELMPDELSTFPPNVHTIDRTVFGNDFTPLPEDEALTLG